MVLGKLGPVFLGMILIAGCGDNTVVEGRQTAGEAHGGVLVELAENQGYVEILNGDRAKVKSNKVGADTTLVAYLLQPDKKTPLASLPPEVLVKITSDRGVKEVHLKPSPEAGDPSGASRFVSAPGPYELNEKAGEVVVTLGDKTVSGSFRGPR